VNLGVQVGDHDRRARLLRRSRRRGRRPGRREREEEGEGEGGSHPFDYRDGVIQRIVHFRPVEKLTMLFAALLVGAGLVRWSSLSSRKDLAFVALAGLLPVAAAFVRTRWPDPPLVVRVAGDFHILASILLVFDNMAPIIRAVSPVDRDPWLIAADRWLTGTDPTRALEAIATPLLSDVLIFFYALFFFHPLVLAALIWIEDRKRLGAAGPDFHRYAFLIVLVFFVSYAGYFLVPALGPRATIHHQGPLPRGWLGTVIDGTLDRLESNKRDVFPSGHTMVTLAIVAFAAKRSWKLGLAFLFFAVPLWVATVYGRYHYFVDVLVGFALTPLVLWAGREWLRRRYPEGPS
jgi:membrane-associated phospholipid phosphatase